MYTVIDSYGISVLCASMFDAHIELKKLAKIARKEETVNIMLNGKLIASYKMNGKKFSKIR
jgi:hypothetical protein